MLVEPNAMALAERRIPVVPPPVKAGRFHAYFVYDVADTIDLANLGSLGGEGLTRAPLHLRREASSGFIEFPEPPVVAQIPPGPTGTEIRAKIFDYGVVSIRISLPFDGSWLAFAAFTRRLRTDDELPELAKRTLDGVLREISHALDDPHDALIEDYFVFEVESFEEPITAMELVEEYDDALASLVLCEERRVTPSERAEALRIAFSYFDDDLSIVQWDTAFVYDRRDGAKNTLDILEFANTQLVELRTYDARLDAELDEIYKYDAKRPTRRFRAQTSPRRGRPFTLPHRRHRRVDGPRFQCAQDHRRRVLRAALSRSRGAPRLARLAEANRLESRDG